MEETKKTQPHIVILPSLGMGHLIPFAEFAKKLVHHHNFSVTLVIPSDGPPSNTQKAIINALPKNIIAIFLPPVNFDGLPEDARTETIIFSTMTRSIPSLRNILMDLSRTTHLVALVIDLFGTDMSSLAEEFNLSFYVFFTSTAMSVSLMLHLPELDKKVPGQYNELSDPIKLPGCVPVHGRDLIDAIQDRGSEVYKVFLKHCNGCRLADGLLINTFMELEPGALKALMQKEPGKPPVYPIGPLTLTNLSCSPNGHDCLKWLDDQPRGSVLFVCFGSGGTHSYNQLYELALGLEMSGQKFWWVAKRPNEAVADGAYFRPNSSTDPLDFLPEGFLDRIKEVGLVVPSWAPQIQILSHGSTGGFLSHCGWNLSLESIVHGIPLIAWPLYAEQNMNAVLLDKDIKVALRPKANGNGLIEREEICRVVKELMEGEEGKKVSKNMRELKDASTKVLSEDGSSTKALSQVANTWNNHKSM